MNDIRKIIEERLENAQIDFKCNINLSVEDVRVLQGQIEAYQDCLNLIPAPRTEDDILKDFEALGYRATKSNVRLKLRNKKSCISIMFETKTINCYKPITMQEHKLLNELFTIWGWL